MFILYSKVLFGVFSIYFTYTMEMQTKIIIVWCVFLVSLHIDKFGTKSQCYVLGHKKACLRDTAGSVYFYFVSAIKMVRTYEKGTI